jgi:hypothetical protein
VLIVARRHGAQLAWHCTDMGKCCGALLKFANLSQEFCGLRPPRLDPPATQTGVDAAAESCQQCRLGVVWQIAQCCPQQEQRHQVAGMGWPRPAWRCWVLASCMRTMAHGCATGTRAIQCVRMGVHGGRTRVQGAKQLAAQHIPHLGANGLVRVRTRTNTHGWAKPCPASLVPGWCPGMHSRHVCAPVGEEGSPHVHALSALLCPAWRLPPCTRAVCNTCLQAACIRAGL